MTRHCGLERGWAGAVARQCLDSAEGRMKDVTSACMLAMQDQHAIVKLLPFLVCKYAKNAVGCWNYRKLKDCPIFTFQ